jgi:hypothetical protein
MKTCCLFIQEGNKKTGWKFRLLAYRFLNYAPFVYYQRDFPVSSRPSSCIYTLLERERGYMWNP